MNRKLIKLAVVGFGAQLVDGALGMGYGVTSSTLLLLVGLSPALAVASVHLSEVGTTLVSGVSHWRLGNVDWPTAVRLALPGAVGAYAGATVLSHLSPEAAQPVTASILLVLGAYIIVRYLRPITVRPRTQARTGFLAPLGLVAGFVDSTGGGGWGPVATTTLLTTGRLEPRKAVGTVDTSEFLVTVSASAGFLLGLGTAGIDLGIVLALLAGGVVAAPLAALAVSRLPARLLGVGVGGLIVLTNLRTLLSAADAGTEVSQGAYLLVSLVWAGVVVWTLVSLRRRSVPIVEEVGAA